MGNKTDLRVTRTIRAIKEAFLKLIIHQPVNKISVAALAKEAEINKGTFYLHYSDLYQLYDELVAEVSFHVASKFDPYPALFSSPEEFVRIFLFSEAAPPTRAELAILKEENLRFSSNYPLCFTDAFRAKIYEVGTLTPCQENDIKLEFIINGMLSILIRPGLVDRRDEPGTQFVIRYLSTMIRHTFPGFYPQPTHEGR